MAPATQAGKVKIEMHNDEGGLYIAVLHNVLYVSALVERLFSIETWWIQGMSVSSRKEPVP